MIKQNSKNSIAGWYFTPAEISETISNGHMINPSIDLSNPCNLNCPYCYIEEKNSPRKVRRQNELTIEETLKIIDDLHYCGAKTINIVGAGEPTIDPHFEQIIEYIYKANMTTVLFTNGIRLSHDRHIIKFLYHNNVSIVLKYNSMNAEIQDLVAGQEGYSIKRDAALDQLISSGFTRHEPTRLGLDIIVFKGNIEEIPTIHRKCRENNIFPIAGEFIPAGRTESGYFQGFSAIDGYNESKRNRIQQLLQPIATEERITLLKIIGEIDAHYDIPGNYNCAYYGYGICSQILGLYIDIEGNVWPCVAKKKLTSTGLEDGLLGNTRKGCLPSTVWKTDAYMRKVRGHFNGGCPYKKKLPFNVKQ